MIKQRGLTLPELMVSMVVGLFILGATYVVFSMSSSSVHSTGQHSQLQESARMGLRMLQNDIAQVGFFGDLTGTDLMPGVTVSTTSASLNSALDCVGDGLNNASFPSTHSTNQHFHFRTIWASHKTSAQKAISCESATNGVLVGTDVLQLKRLDGTALADPAVRDMDEAYFVMNTNEGAFHIGSGTMPTFSASKAYRYIHRVYYVKNNTAGIPSLYMHDLSSAGMASATALVEGVEDIEYEFGVDQDGDSVADTFLATVDVSDEIWDEAGIARIVAVRIHMIVMSVSEDSNYLTDTVTYSMPSGPDNISNDGHRRKKVAITVMMRNPIFVNQRNGI
ncbi:PilW family protein [Ferrimonas lipolytica]|uniref:Prepilin-type N-terminal cleavage/methylation domain-containing protein n=1 Tax=Ferrimonas lipolytica TaxID=2724191 RepID=A0A6H1UI28_9GAMM|nr:PilW family protein [Ferrimonas lipolytica]QIZ78765.1 prepilin-type N-terminal cleavage/methylation domain-containing protein [Ferrimonas lipolytica]